MHWERTVTLVSEEYRNRMKRGLFECKHIAHSHRVVAQASPGVKSWWHFLSEFIAALYKQLLAQRGKTEGQLVHTLYVCKHNRLLRLFDGLLKLWLHWYSVCGCEIYCLHLSGLTLLTGFTRHLGVVNEIIEFPVNTQTASNRKMQES